MRYTRATVSTLLSCAGASALCSCGGSSSNAAAPSVSFSLPAQASSIHLGQSLTLSWSSVHATSCTASTSKGMGGNFSGSQPTNGSMTVAPAATGSFTYILSCSGTGGMTMATSTAVTVGPSILSQLSSITAIGSTTDPLVPAGGNPYGLAIAPATSGLITAGDLIVCNFNDNATTQGSGTTLVGLHPTAGATPYNIAQSSGLQSSSTAACRARCLASPPPWMATAIRSSTSTMTTPAW
jgi:hypothetical protein